VIVFVVNTRRGRPRRTFAPFQSHSPFDLSHRALPREQSRAKHACIVCKTTGWGSNFAHMKRGQVGKNLFKLAIHTYRYIYTTQRRLLKSAVVTLLNDARFMARIKFLQRRPLKNCHLCFEETPLFSVEKETCALFLLLVLHFISPLPFSLSREGEGSLLLRGEFLQHLSFRLKEPFEEDCISVEEYIRVFNCTFWMALHRSGHSPSLLFVERDLFTLFASLPTS